MSELQIRRYRESDQAEVWNLHVVGLMQMGAYAGDGEWDDDMRHIVEHYHNSDGEFLVGEYEGRVVTMGAFRKTGEQEAEIKRMRTYPEFQGRGFAQQIYNTLENRAREMGYTRFHLETGLKQVPAQKFYMKNGFIETHHGTVHLGIPSIFYEKYIVPQTTLVE